MIFINPFLQPKTAISSSVGIQVSSLPGGNRQIPTRGLPYPLGSGAAGSRIYVHQCWGFQVSKAEGQCDVKNIGFALPSTAESWPTVWGWRNLSQHHCVHLGGNCGLNCSRNSPRDLGQKVSLSKPPGSLARAQHSMAKARGPSLGLVGCAAWVQRVLGEVKESPRQGQLFVPRVAEMS